MRTLKIMPRNLTSKKLNVYEFGFSSKIHILHMIYTCWSMVMLTYARFKKVIALKEGSGRTFCLELYIYT